MERSRSGIWEKKNPIGTIVADRLVLVKRAKKDEKKKSWQKTFKKKKIGTGRGKEQQPPYYAYYDLKIPSNA